jgi:hypothetical protein
MARRRSWLPPDRAIDEQRRARPAEAKCNEGRQHVGEGPGRLGKQKLLRVGGAAGMACQPVHDVARRGVQLHRRAVGQIEITVARSARADCRSLGAEPVLDVLQVPRSEYFEDPRSGSVGLQDCQRDGDGVELGERFRVHVAELSRGTWRCQRLG